MRIEIVNKYGEFITDFELENSPFKVGEIINVKVLNQNPQMWDKKEIKEDFVINKIEHFFRKEYTNSMRIITDFTVSIQVTPI